ncbi:MAG: branched-chain amino acid ABC transporter permease [Candidatus Pelethousia sp.]|nr:branched-chain amino acid ABC transporter permease [Candidatus Pelethousia sp.]
MAEYYFSQILNGICQGSIYALMAIGYSVVVGMTNLVTFAFGEIIMVGAFSAYYAFALCNNSLVMGLLASFLGGATVGYFVYKLCYEKFLAAPRYIAMVCTIGASMFLKAMGQIVFGPNRKPMTNIIENKFYGTGMLSISQLQIVILIVVVVVSCALAFIFNKTRLGICFKAVSQEKTAAYMMGINVKKTILYGNCIGCGMGGVAGMLIAIYYQTLQATMGDIYSMKAFASSVLGGLTDIRWSAVGGLLVGLIENIGITLTTTSMRNIFAFLFMFIILLIKPTGLGNKKGTK